MSLREDAWGAGAPGWTDGGATSPPVPSAGEFGWFSAKFGSFWDFWVLQPTARAELSSAAIIQ